MANDIAIVEPERFAGYQDKVVQSNMHGGFAPRERNRHQIF